MTIDPQYSSLSTKIDTIRIFLDDIDFLGPSIQFNGWRAFTYLRMDSGVDDFVLDWLASSLASEINMCLGYLEDHYLIYMLNAMMVHGGLYTLLPKLTDTDGKIKRVLNDLRIPLSNSCLTWTHGWHLIHSSIGKWCSTYRPWNSNIPALLIANGANPYLECCIRPRQRLRRQFSPTTVAMLSSQTFFAWRENLYAAGIQIEEFVKKECKLRSAAERGWLEDSLLSLFQMCYVQNTSAAHPICDARNILDVGLVTDMDGGGSRYLRPRWTGVELSSKLRVGTVKRN